MWIEIFKTGTWTDSNGVVRHWTEEDLEKIVARYDPRRHEAPVVIGHPTHDAPAWGWVEKLRRDGGVLLAKLRDLVPEFVDWVKKGLYKKRSISLYPDFTLRHVGFLGAMPPAVKGLRNVRFEEGGGGLSVEIPFEGEPIVRDDEESAGKSDFGDAVEGLERRLREKEEEAAAAAQRVRAVEEARRSAEARLAEAERRLRRMEFVQYLGRETVAGRLTPRQREVVLEILDALEGRDFSESGRRDAAGLLRELVSTLPAQVEFGEVAKVGAAAPVDDAAAKRAELVAEYMDKHEGVTWREAVLAVSREHPELFREV